MQSENFSQETPPPDDAPAIPRRSRIPIAAGAILVSLGLLAARFALRVPDSDAGVPRGGFQTAAMAPGSGKPSDRQVPLRGDSERGAESSADAASNASNNDADQAYRGKIVGEWTRQYSGTWTMIIRDDGTGEMTVVPDRIWSLIVGSKITIEMTWQVAGGRVIFDSVRGEPETAFKVVMKLWKAHQDRALIEVSDENLIYLSDDGKSKSKWTRGAPE